MAARPVLFSMDYRIEQLRFQVREDPSSRHFYQLGELLRRQGELDEAVEVLRTGLEHHPEYVAAWVSLGRALFQAERFDESRPAFSRALELDRENAVAATMLGRAAARLGDWRQATDSLELASALVPSDEELAREAEEARAHLPLEEVPPAGPGPGDTADGGEESQGPDLPEVAGAGNDRRQGVPPVTVDAEVPQEQPRPAPRPRQLAFVSEEDPWSVAPRGDTGVFSMGEDVFGPSPVEEPAASMVDDGVSPEEFVDGTEPLPGPAGWEEAASSPGSAPVVVAEASPGAEETVVAVEAPPGTGGYEASVSTAPLERPAGGGEAGPAAPVEVAAHEEIPLPTATLARLALEQGDLPLAERTARAVLERDPESAAAREVLDAVAETRSQTAHTPAGVARRKIGALEDWLVRLRRAAAARVS